jgi:mannose-1-phosphate guanylyltransferase
MQIIIVAGGGGTRLWPVSTPSNPKQFVPIIGNKSSLEHVYSHLIKKFDKKNIWINTNEVYKGLVQSLIPELDDKNILLEKTRRDSFAAVTIQAAIVSHFTSRDEVLIFTTSDEYFETAESIDSFNNALTKITGSLENNEFDIITLGIKPTSPNTQYGYIEIDHNLIDQAKTKVVKLKSFKEKPDYALAINFLNQGNFVWNKFNPSFTYGKLREMLANLYPEYLYIYDFAEKNGYISEELYLQLPKVAFDYAILEKTDNIGVITLDVADRIDVGNWEMAFEYLPDLEENHTALQIQGVNNKVKMVSEKKVAFVGVSDLLLVETDNAIMVIDPKYSALIREVSEKLPLN